MNRFLVILFMVIITSYSSSQIVNIENARMHSDTTGLMGNAGASLALTKNTQQIFLFNVNAHVQYKTHKDLYLLLGSYGFLKGSDTKLIDNSFLHFRYNRKINKLLRWEAFTQWQKNTITKIQYRFLLGTGPRFKLADTKKIKVYVATLLMYENEKETSQQVIIHKDWRSSSYVSFSLLPNEHTELISTSFYQPLLKDVSDYRLLNQTRLKVKAGKRLSISLNYNYLFDNFPAAGTPKTNYSFSTGIEYDF
ncbi:MAG: DUF481 domain-containing protein [Bacteroidota bacterium]